MRSWLFSVITLITLLLVVPAASADDKKSAEEKPGKVKVYDFTADSIEGAVVKPDGAGVGVIGFGNHASLIRMRRDFVKEITKSTEDL